VSRAEFDQLKTERDQLVDRIARLQAEFENAASAPSENGWNFVITRPEMSWSSSAGARQF